MNAFEAVCLLFSVLCVLWANSVFLSERIIGKWRRNPFYLVLWIIIIVPAYVSALLPVMEALR